ncbi:MAG TPA: hypothetical protein VG838_13925 [Opitutaceae bacterium]|nr:hypothetical protein [Opitutaceae bacterium]
MNTPSQRKKLPVNPSLEHLQKQAKRRAKQDSNLTLAAAQHQLAQEYGCKTWAELARMVAAMSRRHDRPPVNGERYTPLPKAARYGGIEDVRPLLDSGDFTPHELDQALAHALWYSGPTRPWSMRRALADLFLEHGADPDGQYGSGGSGPIIFGTGEVVDPDALQYLIDAGADVTAPPVATKYGPQCPLGGILGTYVRGKNEAKHRYVELLLQHHAWIPPAVTPPILAIHRGDAAQLGQLIAVDPALLHRQFPGMPYGNLELRGATLLHCAVEFGEDDCIEELLRRGAEINQPAAVIRGVGGQTPIFHAIATNCFGGLPTLEYLARRAGPAINMSVRATWRRFGEVQRTPLTPQEFAAQAAQGGEARWQAKVAEEAALLEELARTSKP